MEAAELILATCGSLMCCEISTARRFLKFRLHQRNARRAGPRRPRAQQRNAVATPMGYCVKLLLHALLFCKLNTKFLYPTTGLEFPPPCPVAVALQSCADLIRSSFSNVCKRWNPRFHCLRELAQMQALKHTFPCFVIEL